MKNNVKNEKLDNIPKKNEKKVQKPNKMNPKVKSFIYIACVVIAILLLALGISFYQNSLRLNNYANVLEGVYRSSYFNMVDKVNTVSVDADKLSNAKDKQSQITYLRNISKNCDSIVGSLSVLSIDSENVVDLTRFFNQLGGLADALTDKVYQGDDLLESDYQQIEKVCRALNNVKNNLNPHNEGIVSGEYEFTTTNIMQNNDSVFSRSLGDMTTDSMEYPSMIFDGPFSAALEKKDVKGLPNNEISESQAKSILNNKVFAGQDVKYRSSSTTEADLDSYDYNVEVLDKKYFAQISKRGGLLLTLCGEVDSADAKIGEDEAQVIAETFAEKLGFENMQTVWAEPYENLCYINLAPIVDDCIYYPDLVKAKVDLTTKKVIGWDSENYAFNHVKRKVSPKIGETEALQKVENYNQILNTNLAIIPLDNGQESLCYEFVTEKDDGTYYIYVSSTDGNIVKIMKEITTDKVHKLI